MPLVHDLRTFLLSKPAVTTITQNIHRNAIPEEISQLPWVRYRRTNSNDDITHDQQGGLTQTIFSIDCFGSNQTTADELADAVRTSLRGYRGAMGGTLVHGAFIRDKSDDYDPFPPGSDIEIPFSSMDCEVWSA